VFLFFWGEDEEEEEDSEVVESASVFFFFGEDAEEGLSEAFLFLGEETGDVDDSFATGDEGGKLLALVRPFCAFSAFLFTGLDS